MEVGRIDSSGSAEQELMYFFDHGNETSDSTTFGEFFDLPKICLIFSQERLLSMELVPYYIY
jgi:hypothetical protein